MDDKKRLLAEQLRLISSLIASVEREVLTQDEIEQQLVQASGDMQEHAGVLIKDEMEEVVKIIILEEMMAGNIAEA